ncbi:hypothetical protein MUK42_17784 [Musa troglodytarum]|uniref:Uncharacterized protein n=1 Tax=Musa troglodytarum TaxID=320322 RepID=A0A9E7GVH6_9LILI|nr:hypothetical protein MUK42_17784 [Musa troglodytarum]
MRTSGLEVVQMTTKACWCATWVAFFPFPTPSSLTCFFNAPPPQARICRYGFPLSEGIELQQALPAGRVAKTLAT